MGQRPAMYRYRPRAATGPVATMRLPASATDKAQADATHLPGRSDLRGHPAGTGASPARYAANPSSVQVPSHDRVRAIHDCSPNAGRGCPVGTAVGGLWSPMRRRSSAAWWTGWELSIELSLRLTEESFRSADYRSIPAGAARVTPVVRHLLPTGISSRCDMPNSEYSVGTAST